MLGINSLKAQSLMAENVVQDSMQDSIWELTTHSSTILKQIWFSSSFQQLTSKCQK